MSTPTPELPPQLTELWSLIYAYAGCRVDCDRSNGAVSQQYLRLAESNLRDALSAIAAHEAARPTLSDEQIKAIHARVFKETSADRINTPIHFARAIEAEANRAAPALSAPLGDQPASDIPPMLDDEGRAMVGASHHYTAENIRSLVDSLKVMEDPQRSDISGIDLTHKDWRAWCGTLWRVIAGLASDVPLSAPPAAVPAGPDWHDCEDQGFSRLSDGCLRTECQTWEPGATRPTHPQLVAVTRHGGTWWCCPKCHGSYGEVRATT